MAIAVFMDWVWLKEGRRAERHLDWLMAESGKELPEEEVWWEEGGYMGMGLGYGQAEDS